MIINHLLTGMIQVAQVAHSFSAIYRGEISPFIILCPKGFGPKDPGVS